MDRVVVVGAGLAGHRAVAALHTEGFAGEVVLVGDERHAPYDRPPLSKALLAGTSEPEDCAYAPMEGEVDLRLGAAATGLDPQAMRLALADGTTLPYDGLVLATGRRARPWIGAGAGLAGVHVLRSADDALALRAAVAARPRVAIVGAGFIGCEVAATLRGLDLPDVTLIDVAAHPMPVLGPEVGSRALALHERHGVATRMGATVAALEESDGHVAGVRLGDGELVEADLVLVALGAVPNTEWLEGSGIELWRGAVRCDADCLVPGAPDVAAAGDCAAWPHPLAGDELVSIEHWAIARDMAATAVRNLLADPADRRPFATVPTFWSDQYDVKLKSAGLPSLADRFSVVEDDPERPALVVEGHRGDELVCALAWNRNKTIISYTRSLAERLSERVPAWP